MILSCLVIVLVASAASGISDCRSDNIDGDKRHFSSTSGSS